MSKSDLGYFKAISPAVFLCNKLMI